MSEKKLLYWAWIKQEAKKIHSDGCTKVPDIRRRCCDEHDLAYYYGRSPRNAYHWYLGNSSIPWEQSHRITRAEADLLIRSCYADLDFFEHSRYWGTRLFGWVAWGRYRKVRP